MSLDLTSPSGPPKVRSGSEARQRQHAVGVRLDEAERELLEARAGDSGLSLSAYLRACALGDAGPRARHKAPVNRELLARTNADLNRVGNNLNQIAHRLNSGGDPLPAIMESAAAELRQTLAVLRRALGHDRQG